MAQVQERGNGVQEPPPIPPDDDTMLDDLAGTEALSPPNVETTPPTAPSPPASSAPDRYDELAQRLQAMDDTMREVRAENTVLRTQLIARQQQAPPQRDDDDPLPSDDDFRTLAKDRPVEAISKIVDRTVRRAIRETQSHVDQRLAMQSETERIRQRVINEFPDIMTDKALQQEAEALYADMGRFGDHRPLDMYTAVASAAARLGRAAHRAPREADSRGDAEPESLRERVLRAQPAPAGITGSGPGERTQAVTPFERDFSDQRAMAAVRKTCRQLGISEDAFRKNYNDMKKADPYYGTGR